MCVLVRTATMRQFERVHTHTIFWAGIWNILEFFIWNFFFFFFFLLVKLWIYTERKKKRKVNFIPKFHWSLKKFVKYFTMITKRYMYEIKVPNFSGLWSTSLELLKFIGSYPPNLEIKIKLKINIGCAPPPPLPSCCPNSPLDRVNQSIDSSHRDVIPFIDQRIP